MNIDIEKDDLATQEMLKMMGEQDFLSTTENDLSEIDDQLGTSDEFDIDDLLGVIDEVELTSSEPETSAETPAEKPKAEPVTTAKSPSQKSVIKVKPLTIVKQKKPKAPKPEPIPTPSVNEEQTSNVLETIEESLPDLEEMVTETAQAPNPLDALEESPPSIEEIDAALVETNENSLTEADEIAALPDELPDELIEDLVETPKSPRPATAMSETNPTSNNDTVGITNESVNTLGEAVTIDNELKEIAQDVSKTAKDATKLAISITEKAHHSAEETQSAIEATIKATERAFTLAKTAGYESDLANATATLSDNELADKIEFIQQKNQHLRNINEKLRQRIELLKH